jgi:hypothetical protein
MVWGDPKVQRPVQSPTLSVLALDVPSQKLTPARVLFVEDRSETPSKTSSVVR